MFAAATTGDPVGSIFVTDGNGVKIPVDELQGLPIQTNLLEFPELDSGAERSIRVDFAIKHIFDNRPMKLVSSNLLERTLKVRLKVTDGFEERVLTRSAEAVLNSKTNLFQAGAFAKKGQTLFIILGTIQARKLEWEFDNTELTRFGLDASFAEMASLTQGTMSTNATTTILRR